MGWLRATGWRMMGPRHATARPNPATLCLPPPRHPFDPEPGHSWSCASDGRYRCGGAAGFSFPPAAYIDLVVMFLCCRGVLQYSWVY
uniref:Uncharacterized protein n=1 Tax=Oryza glaberrima TaxID=4538 RepID=I1QMB4_ORYGL